MLSLSRQLEDPRGIAWSFEISAGVLAAKGRTGDAARLWGVSDKLLEGVGGALSPEIGWIRDQLPLRQPWRSRPTGGFS